VNRKEENKLWGSVYARLFRMALGWTRREADAEDLAQEAITDVLARSPERPTDLEAIMAVAGPIMKGHFYNQRRSDKRRSNVGWLAIASLRTRGLQRTPESLVVVQDRKTRTLALLEQKLKPDALALRIVEATAHDCQTPAEQAGRLGVDIAEIRKARRRVARVMDAVLAAEGGSHLDPEVDATAEQGSSESEPDSDVDDGPADQGD
jgi:DNA-directed RNA polymerase specialized sigma24 family protein